MPTFPHAEAYHISDDLHQDLTQPKGDTRADILLAIECELVLLESHIEKQLASIRERIGALRREGAQ